MKRPLQYLLLALLPVLGACSSEQVVEVELPAFESELVVECYLEPGKPFRLLLQESVGYFDAVPEQPLLGDIPVVAGADVSISFGGQTVQLRDTLILDRTGGKFFNYAADTSVLVPWDHSQPFELLVRGPNGREVRGSTYLLDTIPDSRLAFDENEEGKYSATVQWPDRLGEENHYILAMYRYAEDDLIFSFVLDDRIGDGEDFSISTFYFLDPGDEVIFRVYRIGRDWWQYINSINDAQNSNGNPFAQPSAILSNVQGGIGIFTGASYVSIRGTVPQ